MHLSHERRVTTRKSHENCIPFRFSCFSISTMLYFTVILVKLIFTILCCKDPWAIAHSTVNSRLTYYGFTSTLRLWDNHRWRWFFWHVSHPLKSDLVVRRLYFWESSFREFARIPLIFGVHTCERIHLVLLLLSVVLSFRNCLLVSNNCLLLSGVSSCSISLSHQICINAIEFGTISSFKSSLGGSLVWVCCSCA